MDGWMDGWGCDLYKGRQAGGVAAEAVAGWLVGWMKGWTSVLFITDSYWLLKGGYLHVYFTVYASYLLLNVDRTLNSLGETCQCSFHILLIWCSQITRMILDQIGLWTDKQAGRQTNRQNSILISGGARIFRKGRHTLRLGQIWAYLRLQKGACAWCATS